MRRGLSTQERLSVWGTSVSRAAMSGWKKVLPPGSTIREWISPCVPHQPSSRSTSSGSLGSLCGPRYIVTSRFVRQCRQGTGGRPWPTIPAGVIPARGSGAGWRCRIGWTGLDVMRVQASSTGARPQSVATVRARAVDRLVRARRRTPRTRGRSTRSTASGRVFAEAVPVTDWPRRTARVNHVACRCVRIALRSPTPRSPATSRPGPRARIRPRSRRTTDRRLAAIGAGLPVDSWRLASTGRR